MGEWGDHQLPLRIIAANDSVTCAIYARENGMLDQPGWQRFKYIAKNEKKFTRMVNQAKLKSFHTAPKYKYGYEIHRTY
jgi:predicted secreted protein